MPSQAPTVSVVIPTLDTWELTTAAVASVARDGGPATEVIVVDDAGASTPPPSLHGARLIRRSERGGFSRACNDGIRHARGKLVLLLNSDAALRSRSLEVATAAFVAEPRLGILGATLFFPDGSPQWSGGPEPSPRWLFLLASDLARRIPRRAPRGHRTRDVAWVSGAAMVLRHSMLAEVGLLREDFDFYGQDVDLCWRARTAGWQVRLEPAMQVDHHLGATITGNPERLAMAWADLVAVVAIHRGPTAARRAARALALGGLVRRLIERDATSRALVRRAAARAHVAASTPRSATVPRLEEPTT